MRFSDLYDAAAAICPLRGFSGSPSDRTTWAFDFSPDATPAQIAAVQALAGACAEDPRPALTITGNQWAFALRDLALADAWLAAIPKCKASDQWRSGLISRDTRLTADDPLLARIAAAAGTDPDTGKPRIDPALVAAKALTEPL